MSETYNWDVIKSTFNSDQMLELFVKEVKKSIVHGALLSLFLLGIHSFAIRYINLSFNMPGTIFLGTIFGLTLATAAAIVYGAVLPASKRVAALRQRQKFLETFFKPALGELRTNLEHLVGATLLFCKAGFNETWAQQLPKDKSAPILQRLIESKDPEPHQILAELQAETRRIAQEMRELLIEMGEIAPKQKQKIFDILFNPERMGMRSMSPLADLSLAMWLQKLLSENHTEAEA